MTFARIRLAIALAAFFGWMGWLAYAVSQKGTVQIVSKAQLLAADTLVVATVTTDASGRAVETVTVAKVLKHPAGQPAPTGLIRVLKLDVCVVPIAINGSRDVVAGEYFLPLVKDGENYRVAGLPRSPGLEARTLDRPIVYPWTPDVMTQLRTMQLLPN